MREVVVFSLSEATYAIRTVAHDAQDVYARRIARKLAGHTLVAMAFAIACSLIAFDLFAPYAPAMLLLSSWPVAGVVYLLGRAVSSDMFRYELSRAIDEEARRTQGEVAITALARLRARALIEPRERSSYASLLAGVALLGPLTIHFLVGTIFYLIVGREPLPLRDFSKWMAICGL